MFCKSCVFKNFTKFTGEHLCQKLFFNKVTGLWLDIFLISLYSYVIRNIQIVLTVCLILTKIYFYVRYLSFLLEKSYHLEAAIIHSLFIIQNPLYKSILTDTNFNKIFERNMTGSSFVTKLQTISLKIS